MNCILAENTRATVDAILARELGVAPAQITPDAALKADLNADSLTEIQIVMALEEAFHVTLPDEETGEIVTVEDVYVTVARQLEGTGPAV